jgi:V-type H+-transporting ATPase proteolipid subunit
LQVRVFFSNSFSSNHTREKSQHFLLFLLPDLGGAYGTAKAGQGIMAMGVRSPELIIKNIIPVVMAGVLGIYGLMYVFFTSWKPEVLLVESFLICIHCTKRVALVTFFQYTGLSSCSVAVILNGKMVKPTGGVTAYSQYSGYAHLASGLCCGLASLASGLSIGIAADAGTRAVGAQNAMSASWKRMGFSADAGGHINTGSGDALFVGTVLIQVFAGNIGLYGLISALILSQLNYVCE